MVLLDRESAASDSADLCCHGDRQWLCRFVSVQHVRWIVSGDSCRYLAAALSELSAKNRRCEIHNIDRTVTGRYSLIKWQGDIQILFRNCRFLLKISSKTDKKTELGWDYRTAVIGKKLLHYHVLHLYFRHSVCHIHGIYDIHIVLTSIIFFSSLQ